MIKSMVKGGKKKGEKENKTCSIDENKNGINYFNFILFDFWWNYNLNYCLYMYALKLINIS